MEAKSRNLYIGIVVALVVLLVLWWARDRCMLGRFSAPGCIADVGSFAGAPTPRPQVSLCMSTCMVKCGGAIHKKCVAACDKECVGDYTKECQAKCPEACHKYLLANDPEYQKIHQECDRYCVIGHRSSQWYTGSC